MKELIEEITADIQKAYTEGVTMEEAEKLAAKFLYAQIQFGDALKKADLNARMRKTGVKAVKAAIYLEEVRKADKKPSDVLLGAIVDSNDLVTGEQEGFDTAEVERGSLDNMLQVARDGHIYFRGIAKGRFE